jgi:hypothetical protein
MSEKQKGGIKMGQYLGGIRNIDDLKMRCLIDDETDCWHWRLGKTKGKYPKISFKISGEAQSRTGVRAVFVLLGRDVPDGYTVYHYKCHSIDCLNPAHLKMGTHKEKWAHIKAEGYMRGNPTRLLANKATAMKRCKVAAHLGLILNSDKTSVELAKELGIHASTIRSARSRSSTGAPQVANASVFTWRPAA